ncbi:hypothetical protein GYH30_027716 [Glycine max]|nr:hypothetical protein GYH30_027716 [Glycine max]
MPSTSFIGSYRAFLWSGEDAGGSVGERDNDGKGGKGEHNVRIGSVITKQGGRGGNDREGWSDSASSGEIEQTENVDQHNRGEELGKQSLDTSVFVNSEPLREAQIHNAVKFLSHLKVRGSPVTHRRSFLEKKGLMKEEIDEAFRRVPDSPLSVQTSGINQGELSNVEVADWLLWTIEAIIKHLVARPTTGFAADCTSFYWCYYYAWNLISP